MSTEVVNLEGKASVWRLSAQCGRAARRREREETKPNNWAIFDSSSPNTGLGRNEDAGFWRLQMSLGNRNCRTSAMIDRGMIVQFEMEARTGSQCMRCKKQQDKRRGKRHFGSVEKFSPVRTHS
jgi:hypothetical protein